MKIFSEQPKKLRIRTMPADPAKAMQTTEIDNDLESLKSAIGGGWIEVVRVSSLPVVDGVQIVMVVDEEGLLKNLPHNARATTFYPHGYGIKGDAILVGEAMIDTGEGYAEPGLVGLPENFHVIGRGWG